MDLAGKKINISVLFNTVRIEIACGDDYEAQVLFDDVADTLKAGGKIELTTNECAVSGEVHQ